MLLFISVLFRVRLADRWLFSLSLAQAGEFGFVLLSFSEQSAVISPELEPVLSLVVALSMALTPLMFIVYDKILLPKFSDCDRREADEIMQTSKVLSGRADNTSVSPS